MTGAQMPLALYVHWPFCVSKCPYCDFNSHVRDTVDQEAWRDAILADLAHEAQALPGRTLGSIFFGGGTPSLMPPATVAAVLDAAEETWGFAPDIEITLEANPSSVEAARFADLAACGVNRVSLGLQALTQNSAADPDEADLRIGRHNGWRGGEDVVVSFALEQAGDGGEGDLVVGQAQLAADLIARSGRMQEGIDIHAAIDRDVLLGPADAESWLGEQWRDLADQGVARVTLLDSGTEVYGPMPLSEE